MASLQIPIIYSNLTCKDCRSLQIRPSTNSLTSPRRKIGVFHRNGCPLRSSMGTNSLFAGEGFLKDVIFRRRGKPGLLIVRANQGFNSDDDDGWDKSNYSRVIGNLALAVGLTYLTMTGQLGWLVDAIVSIWLLAVLLPIIGLGAFFWFAGRDMIQGNCPNCGNNFQIFKSSFKDGVQFCPFCTQPFSVQENKFVRESARFTSNRSAPSSRMSMGSPPPSEDGKGSSGAIVDIEAEIKDIE